MDKSFFRDPNTPVNDYFLEGLVGVGSGDIGPTGPAGPTGPMGPTGPAGIGSAGGRSLGTIYDVDFRTLPDQALDAPGAYTVDGLTWYAKNPIAGPYSADIHTEVVNGSGLGIWDTNGASTGNHWPAGSGTPYPPFVYRHIFCPLAQISSYNPAAPLMVRWHMTDGVGTQAAAVFGLRTSTNDGTDVTHADRAQDFVILGLDSIDNSRNSMSEQHGQSDRRGLFPANALAASRAFGIYRFLGNYELSFQAPWSGSFGPVDAMIANDGGGVSPVFNPGPRSNPGLVMGITGQGDASHMFITHLQIMQPKVA